MKAILGGKEYNIEENAKEQGSFSVNGKKLSIDSYLPKKGALHILYNNHSYNAELVGYNSEEKLISLKVNNSRYDIKLKDDTDELLERLGLGQKHNKVQNIKAPMPGLVLDIKVKAGDAVKKGDALLVLEAMKMENIIKAPGEAVVKKVNAEKGKPVEKNQVLIEME